MPRSAGRSFLGLSFRISLAMRSHRERATLEGFRASEQDEKVIDRIVDEQREELEQEIANLQAGASAIEEEIKELVGASPF